MDRCYSELIRLPTFEERFAYLNLEGLVGADTFGGNRWLNQQFYTSSEWKKIRRDCIVRDFGMDLALEGFPIHGKIILHHINPLSIDDIKNHSSALVDLENLVCVSYDTHNAIHFGTAPVLTRTLVERRPNDTCPWKESV